MLFDGLAEANGVIVNQNVDGAMALRDVSPQLFCALNIGQVCLIEAQVLEACIASHCFDVLQQLRLQVTPDVDHDNIDATKLTSSDELFHEEFSQALRTARDHHICRLLHREALFVYVRTEPAHALVENHQDEDEAGGVIVNEVAGQVSCILHQGFDSPGCFC